MAGCSLCSAACPAAETETLWHVTTALYDMWSLLFHTDIVTMSGMLSCCDLSQSADRDSGKNDAASGALSRRWRKMGQQAAASVNLRGLTVAVTPASGKGTKCMERASS